MDQKTNFFNVIRDLHPQAHFVEQQVCLLCSSWFLCQQRDREEKLRLESSSFRPLGKSDEETWRRNIPIKRIQWTMSLIVGTRKSNPILGVLKILRQIKWIQVRIFLHFSLKILLAYLGNIQVTSTLKSRSTTFIRTLHYWVQYKF